MPVAEQLEQHKLEEVRASRNGWLPRVLVVVVVLLALAHNLSICWDRWGDLCIDHGRELVVAQQLSEGKMLYRDLRFYYGPFSPYFNALLFKLFGVHLMVLVWAGLASAGLVCILLYRLTRLFTGRLESTSVTLAFVYLCAFSKSGLFSIFNYATPYTYGTTYGFVFALGSLYFLIRHVRKWRNRDFYLSVALAAGAAFCKQEVLLGVTALQAALFAALLWQGKVKRAHLLGWAAAVAAVLFGYGFFIWQLGIDIFTDNLLVPANEKGRLFVYSVMGIDDIGLSLKTMIPSALLLSTTLACAWMLHRLRERLPGSARVPLSALAALPALGAFWIDPEIVVRAVPVLVGVVLLGLFWCWLKKPASRKEVLPYALLAVFAAALLFRISFKTGASHYGFYLFPASLVVIGLCFWNLLPRVLKATPASRPIFLTAGGSLLCALMTTHFLLYKSNYDMQTLPLETPRGRLLLNDRVQGEPWGAMFVTAEKLLSRFPPGTHVLVMPHGLALTFFSGQVHDFPLFYFMPAEFSGRYTDENLTKLLAERQPDVIVKLQWPMDEYHSLGFGVDYAQKFCGHIAKHYRPYTAIGAGQFIQFYLRPGFDVPPAEMLLAGRPAH